MTWMITNVGLMQLGIAVFIASSALTLGVILGKPKAALTAALTILVGMVAVLALNAWLDPSRPINILLWILTFALSLIWLRRAGGLRHILADLLNGPAQGRASPPS